MGQIDQVPKIKFETRSKLIEFAFFQLDMNEYEIFYLNGFRFIGLLN